MIIALLVLILLAILFPGILRAVFGLAFAAFLVMFAREYEKVGKTHEDKAVVAEPSPSIGSSPAQLAVKRGSERLALQGTTAPGTRSLFAPEPLEGVRSAQDSLPEPASRARSAIETYARTRGETAEGFSRRIGSSLPNIESYILWLEKNGATLPGALDALEKFAVGIKNPEKRRLVQCLDIALPEELQPRGPAPSEQECAALVRRGAR